MNNLFHDSMTETPLEPFRNVTSPYGDPPLRNKALMIYLSSAIAAVCYLLVSIVCCRCYFQHLKKSSTAPDDLPKFPPSIPDFGQYDQNEYETDERRRREKKARERDDEDKDEGRDSSTEPTEETLLAEPTVEETSLQIQGPSITLDVPDTVTVTTRNERQQLQSSV